MTDTSAEKVKLPFVETVKRSFAYFFNNLNLFVKLGSVGVVVVLFDMFADFPTLCAMRGIDCADSWQQTVSTFLLMLVSVAAIILYCRNIVFKNTAMSWSAFLRAVFFYILASVFLLLIIAVPSVILMFVYGMIVPDAGNNPVLDKIVFFIPLLIAIAVAPIFLIFPAIAVEDKAFGLTKVFKIAKGNSNRIFWGQFVMMIPCGIIVLILSFLYGLLGMDNYLINEIFVIVVIAVSLADSCLKASFYAHVYQFFKYYQDKQQ